MAGAGLSERPAGGPKQPIVNERYRASVLSPVTPAMQRVAVTQLPHPIPLSISPGLPTCRRRHPR
jgi:hypothetical protein